MFAQLEPATPASQSDDLRAMFAQLEPANQADVAASEVAIPAPITPITPITPPEFSQESAAPHGTEADWPEALADAFEWPSEPGASPERAQASSHGAMNGYVGPDVTLEALEGAHSAEGYQQFTLEPGALAAFAGAHPGETEPAGETARALDEFFQGPEEPQPAPLEEAPAPPARPTISPTDYPARLAAARSMREGGALDDALVEYRALLKNAPDLLPDVLSDLQASLDEQPEHPELHRLLGDARIRQGDYMAALESLNRSVSLTQTNDE